MDANYLLMYLQSMSKEFYRKYRSFLWVQFDCIGDFFSIRIDCPNRYHFMYNIKFDKLEELRTIEERFEKDYLDISLKGKL